MGVSKSAFCTLWALLFMRSVTERTVSIVGRPDQTVVQDLLGTSIHPAIRIALRFSYMRVLLYSAFITTRASRCFLLDLESQKGCRSVNPFHPVGWVSRKKTAARTTVFVEIRTHKYQSSVIWNLSPGVQFWTIASNIAWYSRWTWRYIPFNMLGLASNRRFRAHASSRKTSIIFNDDMAFDRSLSFV